MNECVGPGNAEETNYWIRGFDAWTAWRSYHFGYSHMTVHNTTTLEVDFLSTNMGGDITDRFVLTKNQSCNFGVLCAPTTLPSPHREHNPHHSAATRTTAPERATRGIDSDVGSDIGSGVGGGTSSGIGSGVGGGTGGSSVEAAVRLAQVWRRAGAVAGGVPKAQTQALVALYHSAGGAHWNRSTNWLVGDPCSPTHPWHGVSCARITERTLPSLWNQTAPRDGVTALHLVANNLFGEIPEGLGPALAPTIQLIDLSGNRLTGTLPYHISVYMMWFRFTCVSFHTNTVKYWKRCPN